MKITFLGGVQVVTGSKYLVEQNDTKILVDCGLFQGDHELSSRNKQALPVEPAAIQAVVLTHAHIDHTGYIPLLVKNGFKGDIYCSKGTYELSRIMLLDSGRVHEQENPNAPLYTEQDAEYALQFFKVVEYDTPVVIGALTVSLIRSGHIIGSAFVIVSDGKRTLTFSGDLGRPEQLTLKPPPLLDRTDYLVIESTYGNRLHEEGDPIKELGAIVNDTIAKGGTLIIPSFAVARTQTILYCLYELKKQGVIPKVPIFLDSPMAIRVTDLFCDYKDEHALPPALCDDIFDVATYTMTAEESKKISKVKRPAIIIAGSGMVTGGRVLHHLKRFISDAKNTVLLVGYQADETEGRALAEGAKEVEIHDKRYEVRAQITRINSLSAHADYDEILEWLSGFKSPIKKLFVTHGELEAAESLKKKIEERFGWPAVVPKYLESYELD